MNATFLEKWLSTIAHRAALAKIELTTPSARTLRYATCDLIADGFFWQPGLSCDPIRVSVEYLGAGLAPASASIRLPKKTDASQTTGTVLDLLSQFLWQNAVVTLYLAVRSNDSEAWMTEQVFKGLVSRPFDENAAGVGLYLIQDMGFNKITPPKIVDKVNYPDSPDGSQNMAIPDIYGDHAAEEMIDWPTPFGSKSDQEDSGAGRCAVPLVLVDAGVGASKVKLVVAGHELMDITDRASGHSTFVAGDSLLNPVDIAGITETLGASESNLTFDDESVVAYAAVIPNDVRATAGNNTALNPRRAMDPFDPNTFASLDQNTSNGVLQLVLPSAAGLGRIESAKVYIGWSGNAGNTHNLRVDAHTPGVGVGGSPSTWASTSTTKQVTKFTWPTGYYVQGGVPTWDFGGGSAIYDLRIDFAGGTTNKASIYWVVIVAKYRPERSLVTPGRSFWPQNPISRALGLGPRIANPPGILQSVVWSVWGIKPITVPPTFKLEAQFYGNVKGHPDNGSGDFTGVAGALIERPPDIARHYLVVRGGVSPSDTETGTGAFGSFFDARDVLRNAQPHDLKLACWIGERSTVQRVVQQIAQQSGMCIYLDRFTNKWRCFVWKPGAARNYDRIVEWDRLASFEAEETSSVDARHAIRVKYGYDYYRSATLHETFVTPEGSGQGTTLPTIRDQRLVVTTGVNDKIDFGQGVFVAATLAAGTYTPMELAAEARSKMRTADAGLTRKHVGHGFSIVAGYNDLIDFTISAVNYQAQMNPGAYSPEGLAVEAARAMNAVPGTGATFGWSYSHATNKFSFTATLSTSLDSAASANSGLPVLGKIPPTATGTALTMEAPRYGDRFWFMQNDPGVDFELKWGTGTNAATNAAYLFGFPKTDTGSAKNHAATYSRGDRERTADLYRAQYGPREEDVIAADWIRDENTAVELRNRRFDMIGRPRPGFTAASYDFVDLNPMHVLEIGSSVDRRVPYLKYGSDGSWLRKPMRALSVVQSMGPSFITEASGVDAGDA